jgi:hypothetical protein
LIGFFAKTEIIFIEVVSWQYIYIYIFGTLKRLSLDLLPLKWWPKPQNTVELFFVSFWQMFRKGAVHWYM